MSFAWPSPGPALQSMLSKERDARARFRRGGGQLLVGAILTGLGFMALVGRPLLAAIDQFGLVLANALRK